MCGLRLFGIEKKGGADDVLFLEKGGGLVLWSVSCTGHVGTMYSYNILIERMNCV